MITVPAYFNDAQRQATKDAGRIAGLDVLRIVNEPTAASLAYGLGRLSQGTIVVYDLGGGTFDVSILRVQDGVFEVLATNGNTHLGGDDFDRVMVEWLLDDIKAAHGADLAADPEAMQELRLAAEAAKCRLSFDERTTLTIPFEGFTYRRDIARRDLEATDRRRWWSRRSDRAGGRSRMPASTPPAWTRSCWSAARRECRSCAAACRSCSAGTPHSQLNPDEVVALGAAVQAQILAGGITDMLLLDVTPLSLGIETLGGIVSVLISRNTTIPTMAKEYFTTSVDGQTTVDMHVLQGERELARDNRSLARFDLAGIDPMPAGMPKIEVTFLIDANGILQVKATRAAHGQGGGHRGQADLRAHRGRGGADGRGLLHHAEADVNARLLIETRNEADTVHEPRRARPQPGGASGRAEELGRDRGGARAAAGGARRHRPRRHSRAHDRAEPARRSGWRRP